MRIRVTLVGDPLPPVPDTHLLTLQHLDVSEARQYVIGGFAMSGGRHLGGRPRPIELGLGRDGTSVSILLTEARCASAERYGS